MIENRPPHMAAIAQQGQQQKNWRVRVRVRVSLLLPQPQQHHVSLIAWMQMPWRPKPHKLL
jgi:hypothetical protein